MKDFIIAPSILAADFARLGEETNAVLSAGADWIHFDVMDNHYVPNLTVGPLVCKALRNYGIKAPIDVHLMVQPVDVLIESFAEAGASIITFHPEASKHVNRSLKRIKTLGCKAGLALNPATSLSWLDYVMDDLDLILVMSVNPGFGGQSFISSSLGKIKQLKQRISEVNPQIRLAVDGGITLQNLPDIVEAGADTIIAGTTIFSSSNYASTIQKMRKVFSA